MSVAPRVAAHPMAENLGRNVLAVASGKGGVGKTWIASTLAHALSLAGRKVLLFDGDLGLANVDTQLGLDVRLDLGAVASGRASLGQAVTRFEAGGFDVLAGKSGSGALADLSQARFDALRQEMWLAARGYDHVVVDLSAGVEGHVRRLIPRAATTMVVLTDEPTSLTDAYAYIKLTRADHADARLCVCVNMARSAAEGERTWQTLAKACRSFLGFEPPLIGIVRRDEKVRDAIRRQTAYLLRHPTGQAAAEIEQLARQVAKLG